MPIELPPGTARYSDRTPPPSNRQLLRLLGVLLGGIVLVLLGGYWAIGLLIDGLVAAVPIQVEQQLGALIVPTYERQAASPSANPQITTTLNQLLDRLETQLPKTQPPRQYQVLYIPSAVVNAAAIPGDRVLIYGGLLKQVESENELMMVLGHELGHFAHRDHLRGLGRSLGAQLLLAWLLGDGNALQSIAVSGVTALNQAQFSQAQEKAADQLGLTLLHGVYGQVAGATDFFDRLSRKENANLAILASHPPSKERIAALEALIQSRQYSMGARSPLPSALRPS
jgi:predicted Zn-dependent protease